MTKNEALAIHVDVMREHGTDVVTGGVAYDAAMLILRTDPLMGRRLLDHADGMDAAVGLEEIGWTLDSYGYGVTP